MNVRPEDNKTDKAKQKERHFSFRMALRVSTTCLLSMFFLGGRLWNSLAVWGVGSAAG
jgi:hypothetical protein